MDDLDLLRDLRADLTPPSRAELLPARGQLLRAIAGDAADSHRAAPRRPLSSGWRLALPAGLALALAAALVVGVRGQDQRDLPVRPGPGATAIAEASPAESDAARLLRNAALAAEHQQLLTVRPDQFVFVESIEESTPESFTCDGKPDQSDCETIRGPRTRYLRQIWQSAGGVDPGLLRERQESGTGGWSETRLDDCAMPGSAPNCRPRPAYLDDLPTDPDAMLAYLTRGEPAKWSPDSDLFTRAGDLIGENYLPPASLTALFQALAKVQGITVSHNAVDAAGRHGVSVGVDGAIRNELIFDPATYAYLGRRAVVLRDGNGLKRGTVDGQSARLRVAIVGEPGQLP
ncbi:CU044_5270 family protein [Micromonospora sp. NPDC049559]|uniref:CU044_5270 family protein n=1 Tax=Micromonospora sp. NPDC049559 TaxID=3155923 RepID=UPI00341A391B